MFERIAQNVLVLWCSFLSVIKSRVFFVCVYYEECFHFEKFLLCERILSKKNIHNTRILPSQKSRIFHMVRQEVCFFLEKKVVHFFVFVFPWIYIYWFRSGKAFLYYSVV